MKYRKIPVEVEAVQFVYTDEGIQELRSFCNMIRNIQCARHPDAKAEAEILTLEDGNILKVKHIATEGDYIVKGVNGEFWAVKPEIFALTYEPIEKE